MATHSILRPGFMVSLKTSVTGGVSYQRLDLDASAKVDASAPGAAVARWETTKVVEDPAEHERASKVRNDARTLVGKHCVATAFGLLCPETRETELFAAVSEAKKLAAAHNATARCTRVSVYVMTGKVASSDEENARAIAEEIRGLIAGMSGAIDRLDPDAIRDAANRAQRVSAMLAPAEAEKIEGAVQAARKAARDIVRRVEKGGELAAVVLADVQRGAIEAARMAFLDLEEPTTVAAADALPAIDLGRVGGLDLSSDASEAPSVELVPANVRDLGVLSDIFDAGPDPVAETEPPAPITSDTRGEDRPSEELNEERAGRRRRVRRRAWRGALLDAGTTGIGVRGRHGERRARAPAGAPPQGALR